MKNHNIHMKDIIKDAKTCKNVFCSGTGRINIIIMSTTQTNLQIQCNPYENTDDIFYRIRSNPKIHMESKRPGITKYILWKKSC